MKVQIKKGERWQIHPFRVLKFDVTNDIDRPDYIKNLRTGIYEKVTTITLRDFNTKEGFRL